MTWNYRVLKTYQPEGEPWYQVHEVYYNGEIPNASTVDGVGVYGESKDDLLWVLDRMREAVAKPALFWDETLNRFRDVE